MRPPANASRPSPDRRARLAPRRVRGPQRVCTAARPLTAGAPEACPTRRAPARSPPPPRHRLRPRVAGVAVQPYSSSSSHPAPSRDSPRRVARPPMLGVAATTCAPSGSTLNRSGGATMQRHHDALGRYLGALPDPGSIRPSPPGPPAVGARPSSDRSRLLALRGLLGARRQTPPREDTRSGSPAGISGSIPGSPACLPRIIEANARPDLAQSPRSVA